MNNLYKVAAGALAIFQSGPQDLPQKKDGVFRVIAVGDSITEGDHSSDPKKFSWPVQLQNMVDTDTIEIVNLGVSGRTMMKNGDYPYWNEPQYQQALKSKPDAVVLMLGTNDAKTYQWDLEEYTKDFKEMANIFLGMDSNPDLHIMVPPPLYQNGLWSMNQTIINDILPDLIPKIAKELGQEDNVISIFEAMGGKDLDAWQYLCNGQSCDGCHPNDAGYSQLASIVYRHLFLKPLPAQKEDIIDMV